MNELPPISTDGGDYASLSVEEASGEFQHADFSAAFAPPAMPWISVAPGAPYFVDENGAAWTPIGQNDAITWPELAGLFRGRDLAGVERHLRWLKAHGVTCLRLMLEYAQVRHRYFERPAGRFPAAMVKLWDDMFALCERVGILLLLTPVDTFWTWRHWRWHPWNVTNGGPLKHPSRLLLCPATRTLIKDRLEFAVRRWSGSGALFAWDLWNEIHPAQAQGSADAFDEFIHDLASHVRSLEMQLHGRSHPLTVSLFGPELRLQPELEMKAPIFRHPDLDFATIHIYRSGSIDNPANTVSPAVAMGNIVRESLAEIVDRRPFLDTEHGPIHSFKDRKLTLPEPFDDEMFRFTAWAHLASGGCGGGMRWPNRHPHVLTAGMRRSQKAMADFLPLVDWTRFQRVNLNEEVEAKWFHVFACGDDRQALIWLLRRRNLAPDGRSRRDAPPVEPLVSVPGLADGEYRVIGWDTERGVRVDAATATSAGGKLRFTAASVVMDRAFVVSRLD